MSHIFKTGDCLELIKKLDNNSIDFCYFNPPFGITGCAYDKPLNWPELWPEIWRVLKPKGTVAIHCSQPFTFDLVSSQRKHFKYCWYWRKLGCSPTGFLFSKYQPSRIMEEICIFYKNAGYYNPQMVLRDKPYSRGQKEDGEYIIKKDGNPEIRKSEYYGDGMKRKKILNKTHNHPTHLIEMKRRNHKFSTRKIEMCEYFLKTYSKEGDKILDLTCSDGQTALACQNLERFYIGFDLDPEMTKLAQKRLDEKIFENVEF